MRSAWYISFRFLTDITRVSPPNVPKMINNHRQRRKEAVEWDWIWNTAWLLLKIMLNFQAWIWECKYSKECFRHKLFKQIKITCFFVHFMQGQCSLGMDFMSHTIKLDLYFKSIFQPELLSASWVLKYASVKQRCLCSDLPCYRTNK